MTTRARPTNWRAGSIRSAAYAVNNLCYLAFRRGPHRLGHRDVHAKALELDPTMTAARNNLALALAASGRIDLARTQFVRGRRPVERALQHRHRLSRCRRFRQRVARVRRGQQGASDVPARAPAGGANPDADVLQPTAGASRRRDRRNPAHDQTEAMITTAEYRDVVPFPAPAQTLEESGLSLDLVLQLALKSLHFAGDLTGTELSRRLGLEFPVVAPALELLKAQHQIAIVGRRPRRRRHVSLPHHRRGPRPAPHCFSKPAITLAPRPVPLAQYQAYMNAVSRGRPARCDTRAASGRRSRTSSSATPSSISSDRPSMPDTRCSSTARQATARRSSREAIHNLLDGEIAIPHALEVEGSIVRIFDPVNHRGGRAEDDRDSLTSLSNGDRRWVRCRRPMVMVGGELTLDSLELSYNPTTGFYRAPVQAVANGGMLVIDDFGRQQCSPRDLLNRWIVPLESRVDFLTLQSGQKFELPFMTLIVFATNIRPPSSSTKPSCAASSTRSSPKARPSRSSRPSSRGAAAIWGRRLRPASSTSC